MLGWILIGDMACIAIGVTAWYWSGSLCVGSAVFLLCLIIAITFFLTEIVRDSSNNQ